MSKTITAMDARMNRLIGQLEGIRRMINAGRSYDEILQQILAARQALTKFGIQLLKDSLLKSPERHKHKIADIVEKIFRM